MAGWSWLSRVLHADVIGAAPYTCVWQMGNVYSDAALCPSRPAGMSSPRGLGRCRLHNCRSWLRSNMFSGTITMTWLACCSQGRVGAVS
jgi:hypothetical protein